MGQVGREVGGLMGRVTKNLKHFCATSKVIFYGRNVAVAAMPLIGKRKIIASV
jgi:hypothetical protein